MAPEMSKEQDHRRGLDVGVGMKTEEQPDTVAPGRNDQPGDRGHFPVGVGLLAKERRLSPRSPSPADERGHQEAALVEEDQRCASSRGVFFTLGQVVLTQRRIASSSRSIARRSGFWGLQPRDRNKRPI